jgi:hypothetical protein
MLIDAVHRAQRTLKAGDELIALCCVPTVVVAEVAYLRKGRR